MVKIEVINGKNGDGNTEERKCYKCGQSGHMARVCPNSESASKSKAEGATKAKTAKGTKPRKEENDYDYEYAHEAGKEEKDKAKCYNCGEGGHIARECPEAPKSKAAASRCLVCQSVDHRAAECPSKAQLSQDALELLQETVAGKGKKTASVSAFNEVLQLASQAMDLPLAVLLYNTLLQYGGNGNEATFEFLSHINSRINEEDAKLAVDQEFPPTCVNSQDLKPLGLSKVSHPRNVLRAIIKEYKQTTTVASLTKELNQAVSHIKANMDQAKLCGNTFKLATYLRRALNFSNIQARAVVAELKKRKWIKQGNKTLTINFDAPAGEGEAAKPKANSEKMKKKKRQSTEKKPKQAPSGLEQESKKQKTENVEPKSPGKEKKEKKSKKGTDKKEGVNQKQGHSDKKKEKKSKPAGETSTSDKAASTPTPSKKTSDKTSKKKKQRTG